MIRFCGIITLGPTFQKKKTFLFRAFLKGPLNLKKHEGSFTKKLDAIVGIAAQALGTALEKKAEDIVEGIKGKITKRLREEPPELEPQSQTQDYAQEETENHLPSRTISAKQSIRSTYRKKRRSKKRGKLSVLLRPCLMEPLRRTPGSLNQLLQDFTQGTSTTTRVGARIALVAIEYFVKIAPAVASVGGEGSMCRMVSTIRWQPAGAVPDVPKFNFRHEQFLFGQECELCDEV